MWIAGNLVEGQLAAASKTASTDPLDARSFERFYERTSRPLWGCLYRLCGDAALADDISQRAYLQFLQKGSATFEPAQQTAFLFRTALNLLNDHWRRQKVEQRRFSLAGWLTRAPEAREELALDVGQIFRQLPERERLMLWLAHVDEAPHKEIADALGVGTASVKVLLHRARRRLLAMLEAKGLVEKSK